MPKHIAYLIPEQHAARGEGMRLVRGRQLLHVQVKGFYRVSYKAPSCLPVVATWRRGVFGTGEERDQSPGKGKVAVFRTLDWGLDGEVPLEKEGGN